jgi:hypothetical protein
MSLHHPGSTTNIVRFLWWNVQDCAHFERSRARQRRWPKSRGEYAAKLDRIVDIISRCQKSFGPIELVGLCEITRIAAEELRDRLFPDSEVFSLDNSPSDPDFHVAFIYPRNKLYKPVGPLAAFEVPETTRPMAVLELFQEDHRIRFIGAHWTPGFDENALLYQGRLAATLRGHIFEFMKSADESKGHVVVMGDLNSEPFWAAGDELGGIRSRVRARIREHPTDNAVRRVRLYNCGWRLLGECNPHNLGERDVAGTYFRESHKTWHTFDQVIVTPSLLSPARPYLAEEHVGVYHDIPLLNENGEPRKFYWNEGNPTGFSDHLPITGAIAV